MDHIQEANNNLIESALLGDERGLERALSAGAELDAKDGGGWTAAMRAAANGSEGCLRSLIARGADVDVKDANGETASMNAAQRGHVECLGLLIAGGADIDAKQQWNKWTAAMIAALCGREACVGLLIGGGADFGARDHRGRTASMLAESNGHKGVAVLIDGMLLSKKEGAELELLSASPAVGAGRRGPRV